jgi:hypothetical protein
MSMPVSDSNDLNTVLLWAMGRPRPYHGHVSDHEATEAARRITAKAYKALGAGLTPGDVTLDRAATQRARLAQLDFDQADQEPDGVIRVG